MLILSDFDDVIVDLCGRWIARYNTIWDDNLSASDLTSWDVYKHVKPECGKQVYDILYEADLYRGIPLIPGAAEALKFLHERGHDIVIVTAASNNAVMIANKVDCMREYMPWLPKHNIIFGNRKNLIHGDVLIDDGPHNLEGFRGDRLLFSRPHNHAEDRFNRVHDWRTDLADHFMIPRDYFQAAYS